MSRTFFGLQQSSFAIGNGDGEFEKRYPEDKYGEEAGPSARVWRLYMDEAFVFDIRLVEEARDTLDVMLVFGGLFSAIVTTFLVQTYESLQPDLREMSTLLLFEMVSLQRAGLNETAISAVPRSPITPLTPFRAKRVDSWTNCLWFVSLLVGLLVVIMAVLVKQWLHHYLALPSGTFRDRAIERQRRFDGLKMWRVQAIVGVLPVLMHLALVLFLAGLTMFLISLSFPLSIVVGLFTFIVVIAYMVANTIPHFYPDCPYYTPLTAFLRPACSIASHAFIFVATFSKCLKAYIPGSTGILPTSRYEPSFTTMPEPSGADDQLSTKSLAWLYSTSSNPVERRVVLEGISGLPLTTPPSALNYLKDVITDPYIAECFRPTQLSQREVIPGPYINIRLERLLRSEVLLGRSRARQDLSVSEKSAPRLKLSFALMQGLDPHRYSKSFLRLIRDCILSEPNATFAPVLWRTLLRSTSWPDSEVPPNVPSWDTWTQDTLYGLLQSLFSNNFIDNHTGDEWDSLAVSDFGAREGMNFTCFRRDMYAKLMEGLVHYCDLKNSCSPSAPLEKMHLHVLLASANYLIAQLEPEAEIQVLRSKAWALEEYHGLLLRLLDQTKIILFPDLFGTVHVGGALESTEQMQWIRLVGKILSHTIVFPSTLWPLQDQDWLHESCHSAIPKHVSKHMSVDVSACLGLESIQRSFFCIVDGVYLWACTNVGPKCTAVVDLRRGLHHFGASTIEKYRSLLSGTQIPTAVNDWEKKTGIPVLESLFDCMAGELDGGVEETAAFIIKHQVFELCLTVRKRNSFRKQLGVRMLTSYSGYLKAYPEDTAGHAYLRSLPVQELADVAKFQSSTWVA